MQVKTVVLAVIGLAGRRHYVIQLYHNMDSLVAKLIRVFVGRSPATPNGPRILPAYAALARFQHSATELEPRLRLLVTQLAAERSRCRWCIERGRHLWREAQFPVEPLRSLLRYETSALYSPRERAALTFTDAVTRYSEACGGMPLEPLTRARHYLSEPEIAAITGAAASQHFFNPITGALGADVAAWGAPIGSQMRGLWL